MKISETKIKQLNKYSCIHIVNKNESEVHNQEGLNDYSDDDFGDEDDEYYSDLDEDGKNYSQSKGPNSQVLSFI